MLARARHSFSSTLTLARCSALSSSLAAFVQPSVTNRRAVAYLPTSVDWREKGVVTPVRDQKINGSCWAFAASSAIESIHAIKRGELVSCSSKQLIDCVYPYKKTILTDIVKDAFNWVIKTGGICEEQDYSYTAVKQSCNPTKGGKMISIDGYKYVPPYEEHLLCAVAKQPVCARIVVSNRFITYEGGIFTEYYDWQSDRINHAVLIVGYGSRGGKDYWIVKNSYGTEWGEDGYIYIRRNSEFPYGICAIHAAAIYPTIETRHPL